MLTTFHLKHIAAASVLALSGLAQAANVVVPTGTPSPITGMTYQGALTLSYSAETLGSLDTAHVAVTSYGGGVATAVKDIDGFYVDAGQSGVITSMTLDSGSGGVVGYASSGGATWTTAPLKSITSGGTLSITDLSVDYTNRHVFATIIGGNGVGTVNNFHLFDFFNVTNEGQTCAAFGPCQYPKLTAHGLTLTSEGFNKVMQSLGLDTLGRSHFAIVTEFGTLTVTAVPEPATCALMGIGLAGMLVTRRRAAPVASRG